MGGYLADGSNVELLSSN